LLHVIPLKHSPLARQNPFLCTQPTGTEETVKCGFFSEASITLREGEVPLFLFVCPG